MTADSPLRWLIRALVLVLLAEAIWRFAQLFALGGRAGLTGWLLIGLTVALCAALLVGEVYGTPTGQNRFALQLFLINAAFLGIGALTWATGNLPARDLAIGGTRLALYAAVWLFYRSALPPGDEAAELGCVGSSSARSRSR